MVCPIITQDAIPFAVVGSNTVVEVGGKKVRGRLYPWGIAEVDNLSHCDFTTLRNMLIRYLCVETYSGTHP